MKPKKDYLEQILEHHRKQYKTIQKIKEKGYQVVERSPTLTAIYVKLTEFCYKLPVF